MSFSSQISEWLKAAKELADTKITDATEKVFGVVFESQELFDMLRLFDETEDQKKKKKTDLAAEMENLHQVQEDHDGTSHKVDLSQYKDTRNTDAMVLLRKGPLPTIDSTLDLQDLTKYGALQEWNDAIQGLSDNDEEGGGLIPCSKMLLTYFSK